MGAPFARFNKLMSLAIAALSSFGGNMALAVDSFGGYKSRGKGKGHGRERNLSATGSKYTPHQSLRECARRVRQMERSRK